MDKQVFRGADRGNCHIAHTYNIKTCVHQGRNWLILRGGRRYIYNRKDEIIHGPSPSVKCIAHLFKDIL